MVFFLRVPAGARLDRGAGRGCVNKEPPPEFGRGFRIERQAGQAAGRGSANSVTMPAKSLFSTV